MRSTAVSSAFGWSLSLRSGAPSSRRAELSAAPMRSGLLGLGVGGHG